MPQLDPTWYVSQLFWLVICMAVLYVSLSRYILPPLLDIKPRREAAREKDLARAKELQEEAEKARLEYERFLADMRHRAQAILAEVEEKSAARLKAAEADLAEKLAARTAAVEEEIMQKRRALASEIEPLAEQLAGAVVQAVTRVGA